MKATGFLPKYPVHCRVLVMDAILCCLCLNSQTHPEKEAKTFPTTTSLVREANQINNDGLNFFRLASKFIGSRPLFRNFPHSIGFPVSGGIRWAGNRSGVASAMPGIEHHDCG